MNTPDNPTVYNAQDVSYLCTKPSGYTSGQPQWGNFKLDFAYDELEKMKRLLTECISIAIQHQIYSNLNI